MKLGVCYYPEQWPVSYWQRDAQRMVEMGISYVRIAEFTWSLIEPQMGQWNWQWLDQIIEILAAQGLKIVLCTPTATPPKWLVDAHPEILPIDALGHIKHFGSRRHYCFSSQVYRQHSKRISQAMVDRYGQHEAVVAWQTDNEYGCHFTVESFSKDAALAFRVWLKEKYGTIQALNKAWANIFWSQSYASFDEVDPPYQAVTEILPIHKLDWKRFSSDQVKSFNLEQVKIIRQGSPARPVSHNFMGFFTEFDHYQVSQDLDIATLDSYPIGFTQMFFLNEEEKIKWAEVGHPDIPSFHYDLYKGMCKGNRWWIMEQQPGPVNWAHWNPIPKDGMVRLWSWQAFAHGCELVSYFRWRQTPYAQEQMHAGLLAPDDTLAQGALEVAQLSQEIKDIQNQNQVQNWQASSAKVALLFDYDSMWMSEISPQGKDYLGIEQVFRIYSALRSLALDVDIISTQTDLINSQYQLIVLPAQWHVNETLKNQLEQLAAKNIPIVLAPRVGSKTENLSISEPLAPGPLTALAGLKVKRVSSLPPGIQTEILTLHNKPTEKHHVSRWQEDVECLTANNYWTTVKNQTVVAKNNTTYYVASWLMQDSWKALFSELCVNHQIDFENLPEGIRVSRMSACSNAKDGSSLANPAAIQNYQMVVNYSDRSQLWQPTQVHSQLLMGSEKIQAQQVAIWKVL